MVGRAVAGTALVLLFISLLTSAFTVKPAMASNPVYIRADGSIDPPESPISSIDNTTFTLTDNIYGSITIERDNIQVDVAGHTLQGTGSEKGIYLSSRNNVTIRNADIRGFQYGIFLWHCSNITMLDNNATANNYDGISMWSSSSITLLRNRAIANNVHGIYVLESSNNNLVENNATANKLYGITIAVSTDNTLVGNDVVANENDGITISASANNTLTGNIMQGNRYNFGIYGYSSSDFVQSIDTSNLINDRPVYYFMNETSRMMNPGSYQVGYLGLVNCVNMTVEGLDLVSNVDGLMLANTNDSRVAMN
ncbi:right-handed parallel beta-helix repeat-containing protein, partial [Candidatus Bathyarchaeota archaeon]|nr:right-handed parallel beta-helix repeat-containing protein [Candidatus Bathyarchaeota archaeon]